ncbi:MAG: alanine racemase [Chloroflexota bacterium]|nr:alanine racemase [Chloroflexota bacterium]
MNVDRVLAAAEPHVTPLAVVDEETMRHNIVAMQELAKTSDANLRPHAKTHKSARVARRQIEAGAIGLTVATLHEAEYFAGSGVTDLLLAHPPVGAVKRRRLAALASRVERLAVSTDSVEAVEDLPESVDVFWEVDTGLGRVGTPAGTPTVEAVRDLVDRIGPERLRGLLAHAGHAYRVREPTERHRIAAEEMAALLETAASLHSQGIEVTEISVGSTATAEFAPEIRGATEMRPGTYVYGDANQVTLGSHALEHCALGVVATVVSIPALDRLIVDAGSKALSADPPGAGVKGYGMVLGRPDWTIEWMNEEHGVIRGQGTNIGDRVVIVPAHVCTTVNLHGDVLVALPDGTSEWEHVVRGWQ